MGPGHAGGGACSRSLGWVSDSGEGSISVIPDFRETEGRTLIRPEDPPTLPLPLCAAGLAPSVPARVTLVG